MSACKKTRLRLDARHGRSPGPAGVRLNALRLEIGADAPAEMREFLCPSLGLSPEDVIIEPGPLDLSGFMQLQSLEGFDMLRDPIWVPQRSPQVDPTQSMFTTLTEGDLLLCHPYESFEPVVRLVEEAASDPDVLAIKQTLYRTSRKSPIVAALCRAAERGKYVTAIVELKARFDEARNIEWARELEEAVSKSSTVSRNSRRMPSAASSSAANPVESCATCTSEPATTTKPPRACIAMSAT